MVTHEFWPSMESDHRKTFFKKFIKFRPRGNTVESSNGLLEIPFSSRPAKSQVCTKFKNTINAHGP